MLLANISTIQNLNIATCDKNIKVQSNFEVDYTLSLIVSIMLYNICLNTHSN